MEGPSLVIACEEFKRFNRKRVASASGTAPIRITSLKNARFMRAGSWGKHFLLYFPKMVLRIHFLMFGSYRINDPRPNRIPKLALKFGEDRIYFYSCAIKELDQDPIGLYDWSTDVMSEKWNSRKALQKVSAAPEREICDVLMDQDIFSGVGNIIKNEVLFRLRLHPSTTVGELNPVMKRKLVSTARAYSLQFYRWKKKNVLKRNWQVFRKKTCPVCGTKIQKKPTGKGERISHFCRICQARS